MVWEQTCPTLSTPGGTEHSCSLGRLRYKQNNHKNITRENSETFPNMCFLGEEDEN